MFFNKKLIEKYNIPVPRYTSYPPANHFKDGFLPSDYMQLIRESNQMEPDHIAIYIHIPFCNKICFYCGCNSCTIKSNQLVNKYISAVKKEISMVAELLDKNRKVSQIHFGGGTPNAIKSQYIKEINDLIFSSFDLIDNLEIAIECNPAELSFKYIDDLLAAGFNRFSLGIQDFNQKVLKVVNRDTSIIPVNEIVAYLRSQNPSVAVNLDFIYGLPLQNPDEFVKTIKKAIEIKPDRLVTFSYAHVPWIKKHQKILEKRGLPSSELKMKMFLSARKLLIQSGYIPIGLDHYVLPDDELHLALSQNSLHRNFQGYCTRRTTGQVYAFGVSSISQLEKGYVQNIKELEPYIHALNDNKLPVEKGLLVTQEQRIIRDAITELMCNQKLNLLNFAEKYDIDVNSFRRISGFKEASLKDFINDELITFNNDEITVTTPGSLFIRNIAATFDPAFKTQKNKYSKTV